MTTPSFFLKHGPFSLGELADICGGTLGEGTNPDISIDDVAAISDAAPGTIVYASTGAFLDRLRETRASACIVTPALSGRAETSAALVIHDKPGAAFAEIAKAFYPEAARMPFVVARDTGSMTAGAIHPEARIEDDVVIEPGAVVGADAEIGRGSRILAGSVVGHSVRIGRDCVIGPNVTVTHALIGDRVILHAGVCVGQDGFGYHSTAEGHVKIVQVGRVIVQDDVEIGAATTVDRGALSDTVIGEGTKIDNQVQIAHNVVIGRHCIIVAHVAIGGSAHIGDFVALGGKAVVREHVSIVSGAQIAATASVSRDIPTAGEWGGSPVAQPMQDWVREFTAIKRLVRAEDKKGK